MDEEPKLSDEELAWFVDKVMPHHPRNWERANRQRRIADAGRSSSDREQELDRAVKTMLGEPIIDPDELHRFAAALRGEPVIDAEVNREFLAAVLPTQEGTYDPAKHPRGGYPQHPGEWSPAGGSGSGSSGPPSTVVTTPANPFHLASASSKDHAIAQAAAKGDLATLKDLINSGGLSAAERNTAQAAINRLTDTAQGIISKELEGRVMREFPREMLKMKLKDIMDLAKGIGPLAGKAKKALKLLKDNRFKK